MLRPHSTRRNFLAEILRDKDIATDAGEQIVLFNRRSDATSGRSLMTNCACHVSRLPAAKLTAVN